MRRRRAEAAERTGDGGTKGNGTALSPTDFDDMMHGPIPTYEETLRMCVRRLTNAMESDTTSARDLAPISRSLLQAAKELEAIRDGPSPDAPISERIDDTFDLNSL
ncbi:hypothetical protein [Bifidobacterium mongoliense]|jgi:hypothetical protein